MYGYFREATVLCACYAHKKIRRVFSYAHSSKKHILANVKSILCFSLALRQHSQGCETRNIKNQLVLLHSLSLKSNSYNNLKTHSSKCKKHPLLFACSGTTLTWIWNLPVLLLSHLLDEQQVCKLCATLCMLCA